ncbi:hypothetical protein SLS62_011226 [Diatrype stigma]|uniref:Capsule polysaccharide biosynthesis protein n=1 Tax=Diatrype stigma TaxID=117547 RepID=A0AAN9YEW9_9PEZI
MASSAAALKGAFWIALPTVTSALAYGTYKFDPNLVDAAKSFFTGPGSYSRIIALGVIRVWHGLISSIYLPHHKHTPDKLFHPVISESHVTLLEVDYNIHKSNSTYFADLDVSRTHLVGYLLARGLHGIAHNAKTKLVMDPSDPAKPAKGKLGIMLGAVECSFKREIKPYAKFEMWSRVLAWDRKWMYIVTHFVEKGTVKPRSWDDGGRHGPTRKNDSAPQDWEKKIYATAISKYVFKIGRLTVHPAVIIGASGLLPERPGGWVTTTENGAAKPTEPVTGGALDDEAESSTTWDWRRTEEELNKGLQYAQQFASLDGMHGLFDGGEDGALGKFGL